MPNVRVRYTTAQLDGFTESGVADPLRFDARRTERLDTCPQLATTFTPVELAAGRLDVSLLGELDAAWTQGNDIGVSAGAQSVTFANENAGQRYGGFAAVRAHLSTGPGAAPCRGRGRKAGG
ncbi:hypothetical protein [Roseobacter sp. HKCCA0434]|uniref:hypothetical protein n=1 Tax=Roseobacter sp. HKCCA0434 TaxID=3079297 RepID=UPI002905F06D|nr:hypothetical protein [Roseobacter sp. HKCCA0434]